MRFREFRLPFAGALLLAASGLTFAFATNGAGDSAATVERPTIAAAPSVTVVRRVEPDRHVVTPVSKRPAAAHIVAARTLRAPVPSRTLVPLRPRPRTAVIVAHAPVKHSIALVVRKRAAPPSQKAKAAQSVALRGAAIASQPFSIVRFVGSKRTIARGDSVTLCARATGAEHLRIVPLGPIDPLRRTCRIVRPRKTTTYTLLAQGPGGDKMTQNVTIAVNKRTTPPPGHATPPLDHDPGP